MGLFDFMKGRDASAEIQFPANLGAVAKGTVVPMEELPDEVFSTGVLGQCCGVEPKEGKVYAPAGGKIIQLADTLHAIGIEASGMELLIHVGVDTVDMNGDGFAGKVKLNQTVKKGDLLLNIDLEKIRAANHPSVIILAVTNSDDFASVRLTASGSIEPGENLMEVKK